MLYGGFAGNEVDRDKRNWLTNVTILSGDIGEAEVDTDNVYHVIMGSGTNSTAVLDGFTVTGGYASGSSNRDGGGMYNSNGSPTIRNVTSAATLLPIAVAGCTTAPVAPPWRTSLSAATPQRTAVSSLSTRLILAPV